MCVSWELSCPPIVTRVSARSLPSSKPESPVQRAQREGVSIGQEGVEGRGDLTWVNSESGVCKGNLSWCRGSPEMECRHVLRLFSFIIYAITASIINMKSL